MSIQWDGSVYSEIHTTHHQPHLGTGGPNQRKAKAQTSVEGGHAVRHIRVPKSSLLYHI